MVLVHFMRTVLRTAALAGAAAAIFCAAPAAAAQCGEDADGFDNWLVSFKREATHQGIPRRWSISAPPDVAYDHHVISHDRGQKAFRQSLEQFSANHITVFGLRKARLSWLRHAERLRRIERRYGVPGTVLASIWGLETASAQPRQLSDLPRARHAGLPLPSRGSLPRELLAALKIVQRGDLQPSEMHGAWAGEIGQTQFLPSSYLKYAVEVDGNRNGGDLINSPGDALASTANFLHANGWQRGAGWDEGQPNFAALLEWNKAHVYAKTVAAFADKLAGAADDDQQ